MQSVNVTRGVGQSRQRRDLCAVDAWLARKGKGVSVQRHGNRAVSFLHAVHEFVRAGARRQ
jgi:hypothetical protein